VTVRANVAGGTAVAVLMGLTVPLFLEFYDRRAAAWNIVLVLLLVGVAVAAFFLQRFFAAHAGEIGEARFDTRNKSDLDG
jgi:formate-dependent nitrite reductase membrane component NrfD